MLAHKHFTMETDHESQQSHESQNGLYLQRKYCLKIEQEESSLTVSSKNSVTMNSTSCATATKHRVLLTEDHSVNSDHLLSEYKERHCMMDNHITSRVPHSEYCHTRWRAPAKLPIHHYHKHSTHRLSPQKRTFLHSLILHTLLAAVLILSLATSTHSLKSVQKTSTRQSLSKSSSSALRDVFYLQSTWQVEEIDTDKSTSLVKPRLRISKSIVRVGHLFQATIQISREETDDPEIQYQATEAGRKRLPLWVHLDPFTGGLSGVPLVEHTGKVYLSVDVHIDSKDGETEHLNEVFSIQVVSSEAHAEKHSTQQASLSQQSTFDCEQKSDLPASCLPNETPLVANIIFISDFRKLTPLHRANLFLAVSDLTGVCVEQIWLNSVDWSSASGVKLWSQLSEADFRTVISHATIISFLVGCKAEASTEDSLELSNSVQLMENILSVCGNGVALDQDAYIMADCYQWFITSGEGVVAQSKYSREAAPELSRVKRQEQLPGEYDYNYYDDLTVSSNLSPTPAVSTASNSIDWATTYSTSSGLAQISSFIQVSSSIVAASSADSDFIPVIVMSTSIEINSDFSSQLFDSTHVPSPTFTVPSSSNSLTRSSSVASAISFESTKIPSPIPTLLVQTTSPHVSTSSVVDTFSSTLQSSVASAISLASTKIPSPIPTLLVQTTSPHESPSSVVDTFSSTVQSSVASAISFASTKIPSPIPTLLVQTTSPRVSTSSVVDTFSSTVQSSVASAISFASTKIPSPIPTLLVQTTSPHVSTSSVVDTFSSTVQSSSSATTFSILTQFSTSSVLSTPSSIEPSSTIDSATVVSFQPSLPGVRSSSTLSVLPSARVVPSSEAFTFFPGQTTSSMIMSSSSRPALISSADFIEAFTTVPRFMISSIVDTETLTTIMRMIVTPTTSRAFSFSIDPTIENPDSTRAVTPSRSPTPSTAFSSFGSMTPSASLSPSISSAVAPSSSVVISSSSVVVSSPPPSLVISTPVSSIANFSSTTVRLSTTPFPTPSLSSPITTQVLSSSIATTGRDEPSITFMPPTTTVMEPIDFTPTPRVSSIPMSPSPSPSILMPMPTSELSLSISMFTPLDTSASVSVNLTVFTPAPTVTDMMSETIFPPTSTIDPVIITTPMMTSLMTTSPPAPMPSATVPLTTSMSDIFDPPMTSSSMPMVIITPSVSVQSSPVPTPTSIPSFSFASITRSPSLSTFTPDVTMTPPDTSSVLLPETTPLPSSTISTVSSIDFTPTPSFVLTSSVQSPSSLLSLTPTPTPIVGACDFTECVNGTCMEIGGGGFVCECYVGWTGEFCDIDIDYCFQELNLSESASGSGEFPGSGESELAVEPCDLVGTEECVDGNSTYTCICYPGFTGRNCNIDIDECLNGPCSNNGTCVNEPGSFSCQCASNTTGPLCEIDLTPCSPNPCSPNQQCIDLGDGGFECQNITISTPLVVSTSMSSVTTMTSLVMTPTPSPNVSICNSANCGNGTCVDLGNVFRCECYIGWTGEFCDIDIDYCYQEPDLSEIISGFGESELAVEPCDLVGTEECVDGNSTYTCVCYPGFTGRNCNIDIDECLTGPCLNNGTCVNEPGSFSCQCANNTTGPLCEIDLTPCSPNPCLPNQECIDLGNGGFDCQNITVSTPLVVSTSMSSVASMTSLVMTPIPSPNVSICNSADCGNGTCVDLGDFFRCECYIGWTGEFCDIDIDYCYQEPDLSEIISGFGEYELAVEPCDLVGTEECVDGNSTYTCTCYPGFTGRNCNIDIDECPTGPCLNNGTCVNQPGSFSCQCASNTTGPLCEIDLTPCSPNPCLPNQECIDLGSGSFECQNITISTPLVVSTSMSSVASMTSLVMTPTPSPNVSICNSADCGNGTCVDLGDVFRCECYIGWTGQSCDVDIDYCADGPCFVNGTIECLDGNSSHVCECIVGYTGQNCSVDIDECESEPCMNNGTCTNDLEVAGKFSCECVNNYTGIMCEIDLIPCSRIPDLCKADETCINNGGGMFTCVPVPPMMTTMVMSSSALMSSSFASTPTFSSSLLPTPNISTTILPSIATSSGVSVSTMTSVSTSLRVESSSPMMSSSIGTVTMVSSTAMFSSMVTSSNATISSTVILTPTAVTPSMSSSTPVVSSVSSSPVTSIFSTAVLSSTMTPSTTAVSSTVQVSSTQRSSVISMSPSTTIISSSMASPTPTPTPVPVNADPILLNPVGTFLTNEGQLFQFSIPDNTFYDLESGATNQLRLSLLDSGGNQLPNTTWVQLRYLPGNAAVIEGIPLRDHVMFRSLTEHVFLLRAEDDNGGVAYDLVTVQVTPPSEPVENFVGISFEGDFELFSQNLTAKIELYTALSSFGADGNTDVYIGSFSSGSIVVTYSNLSIPNGDCADFQEWVQSIFSDGGYTEKFISSVSPFVPTNDPTIEGPCDSGTEPPSLLTPQPPGEVNPAPRSDVILLLATVVPATILACCCLLIGILAFVCYRRKRSEREYLTLDSRRTFLHRRPIVLEGELALPPRGGYPRILANEPAVRFEDERREAPRRRMLLEEVDYYEEESDSDGEEVPAAPLLVLNRRDRFSIPPDELPPEYVPPPAYSYPRFRFN